MAEFTARVETKGRFFTQGNAIIRRGLQNAIQALMEKGEDRLNAVLTFRPGGVYKTAAEARGPGWRTRNPQARDPASTGHYRRSLHTTIRTMYARIDDGRVIYGPWLEGTSRRNQTTRFKGYASFRKTRDLLEKAKPEIVRRHINRAVQEINA